MVRMFIQFGASPAAAIARNQKSFETKTRAAIRRSMIGRWAIWPIASLWITGCDPIVAIAGADFPCWLICLIAGAVLAAITRPPLLISRLEPHLGPLPMFYSSLTAMFAMIVWIIFFNRV
jgi:YtcA family